MLQTLLLAIAIAIVTLLSFNDGAFASDPSPFFAGADISMLPEIEKAGGVFRDRTGKPADALQLLRERGCNLFRVRLFVNPTTDFNKSYGATQDLAAVRALAQRIKSAGGAFLLDLHYSDTWADPGKQHKPAAWKDLAFDALEQKVEQYTTETLKDLRAAGAAPDMVQVGNEIASGILWPDGKVADVPKDQQAAQWDRFARLVRAGIRAVRSTDTPDHKSRVVIHIHGGGRPGLPQWFFKNFNARTTDYDVIALSCYPAWGDTLDALKQNATDLARDYGKDILIAETSYPWRPMEGVDKYKHAMTWPQTPEGQKQFLLDLSNVLHHLPDHHGLGFVWWYPEAIPLPNRHIWRNGAEALFTETGTPLPALDAFHELSR